jgi:hypothetical protein
MKTNVQPFPACLNDRNHNIFMIPIPQKNYIQITTFSL